MSDSSLPSLSHFEYLAFRGQREQAAGELFKLLTYLNLKHGGLEGIGSTPSGDYRAEQRDARFATRLAAAIAALFSQPDFQLSQAGFQHLIPLQRWLTIIFGASPLGNADHIINIFNQHGPGQQAQITMQDRDLVKFSLLYSLDSAIPMQAEALWQKDKRLAAALFFALLSSRMVVTEQAHDKREQLLGWLPAKLGEVSLDDIPIGVVHDVWMHCSYALGKKKHDIKRAINRLIRAKLLDSHLTDLAPRSLTQRDKPILMCILEWFHSNHSIYRTHSLSMNALKAKFHLVGVSLRDASDELARSLFDEVHVLRPSEALLDAVARVREIAARLQPDLVYYSSVGMFPDTVFLTNLRLAPIQIVALGHPATTHSEFIDYVIVEEDYVGDPDCFSEKVVAVPRAAMPYRPPANCPVIAPRVRSDPDPVRIAVAASIMKINPVFLQTLKRIADSANVGLEFHFFSSSAFGLNKVYLENVIRRTLGQRAVIYPDLPYAEYLEKINGCDMFLNPFPFGNTNGIVDTVRQALPGICLTGPEVHSHIDEGLFRRLGMPEWLIAKSVDQYVTAAVRLLRNSSEREQLARQIMKNKPDEVLFRGDAPLFCDAIDWLRRNHSKLMDRPTKLLRPPSKQAPPQRTRRK
jgi:hypothetical protein